MRKLSSMVFDIGYFPEVHESVKDDFLSWYYKGSKSQFVKEELDVENSQLSKLAQEAGTEAEKFNQNNEIVKLTSIFEEMKSKIDTCVYYISIFAFLIGGSFAATGVLHVKEAVFSLLIQSIGGVISVSGIGIIISYKILIHQINTSSELVTKFNKELVEKPGDIRDNDQDWYRIAAQFFWNRSLLSPSTHICLIVLSIIYSISEDTYDVIADDLRNKVHEFAGMNSWEIIHRQIQRAIERDFPPQSRS